MWAWLFPSCLNLHAEDEVLGIRVAQDIGMDHLKARVHQGPDKFGYRKRCHRWRLGLVVQNTLWRLRMETNPSLTEVGVALFEAEMDTVAAKLLLSQIKRSNYAL